MLISTSGVLCLTFNLVSSVGIILLNKIIFSSLSTPFRYPCALSVIHYIVTYVGLLVLESIGVFASRNDLPMTPRLWMLSLVVGIAENTLIKVFIPSINKTESLGFPLSISPPDFLISSKIDRCLLLITEHLICELYIINTKFFFVL